MKTNLKFRPDGTFRILQITDVHLSGRSEWDTPAIKGLALLLEQEKPDMIAFTGDISCDGADGVFVPRLRDYLAVPESMGIPYTYTLGNHESDPDEKGNPKQFLMAEELSRHPLCIFEAGDPAMGVGNYDITVERAGKPAWAFYHLDSHCWKTYDYGDEICSRDDVIWENQKQWLADACRQNTQDYGMLPSLLFIHSPLPEFNDCWMFNGICGDRGEPVCCMPINTGVFSLIYRLGGFKGVFSGHDHSNSFRGEHLGILLAYGRCSGNYGWSLRPYENAPQWHARRQPKDGSPMRADTFPRGGRMIVLQDDRIADTYIVSFNGERVPEQPVAPVFERCNFWAAGIPDLPDPPKGFE